MILRCLFATAVALLMCGCSGWVAETRLIPVAERDSPGLVGFYVGDEKGAALIAPGEAGFVRFADPEGKDRPVDVAFDLLREDPPEPPLTSTEAVEGEEDAPPAPDRSYLAEMPIEGDEGRIAYLYTIVRVSGSAPADSITQFSVLCSKAAAAFAARKEDQVCVFDDYARLRAAALDALAWQDEARLAVDSSTFRLQSEADPMPADSP
jgi:hypothetical protein